LGANDFDDMVQDMRSKSGKANSTDRAFEETVDNLNPDLKVSRGKRNHKNGKEITAQYLIWRFSVGAVVFVGLCFFGCNWVLLRLSVDYPDYLGFLGVICGGIIGGLLNIAAVLVTIKVKDTN